MPNSPDAVYLHIGHGKTGSSFLQSALALSERALTAQGIVYPIEASIAAAARQGHITGGNLKAGPGALAETVARSGPLSGRRLLISGESLFFHILRDGAGFIEEYRAACGAAPLHVLCYLRDPLDHAISQYQQRVKRSGYTGGLADSLTGYDMPRRVVKVLSPLREAGARLTVLNYSRHKTDLLGTMEDWLGLEGGQLTAPETGRVNRSLSNAELELQRAFNRHIGPRAHLYISDPLCNGLPEIGSETPPLDRPALEAFLQRIGQMMAEPEYQALVPAAERPQIGSVAEHIGRFPAPPAAGETPRFCFSGAQLEVIAAAVAGALAKHETRRPAADPEKSPV